MVTYDIGRLPVLKTGQLMGLSPTDVLRELHRGKSRGSWEGGELGSREKIIRTLNRPSPPRIIAPPPRSAVLGMLTKAALQAEQRGWHLYLVGGAVRDLLLAEKGGASTLMIQDIDLVVDSFQSDSDVGAGVELARALQQSTSCPLRNSRCFQTAALCGIKTRL